MSKSARVVDVVCAMGDIAPPSIAAEWDNVGLLVGAIGWPLRRVLMTIDLTGAVLAEAIRGRFDAIVSYHPPIFRPTKSMHSNLRTQEGIAATALSERIAVYSPHTALDAAPGGTNDVIAELCGLEYIEPVRELKATWSAQSEDALCKVVVFVPEDAADRVAEAIYSEGGGLIGDYRKCSFRSAGEGTFFGSEGTHPRRGKKGRLERVREVRLEVIMDRWRLRWALESIRKVHPYEEPAIDVYPLESLPKAGFGEGREGTFPKPTRADELAARLRRKIGATTVSIVGNRRAAFRSAQVWVGAAGGSPTWSSNIVVTGELRHHDALRCEREGGAAIVLGHWASERPVLKPLAARLKKELPGVEFVVSRADRDPFIPVRGSR